MRADLQVPTIHITPPTVSQTPASVSPSTSSSSSSPPSSPSSSPKPVASGWRGCCGRRTPPPRPASPEEIQAMVFRAHGQRAMQMGDYLAAADCYLEALALTPGDPQLVALARKAGASLDAIRAAARNLAEAWRVLDHEKPTMIVAPHIVASARAPGDHDLASLSSPPVPLTDHDNARVVALDLVGAVKAASAARGELDALRAQQSLETDSQKRAQLQIKIYNATNREETAQSRIAADRINMGDRPLDADLVAEVTAHAPQHSGPTSLLSTNQTVASKPSAVQTSNAPNPGLNEQQPEQVSAGPASGSPLNVTGPQTLAPTNGRGPERAADTQVTMGFGSPSAAAASQPAPDAQATMGLAVPTAATSGQPATTAALPAATTVSPAAFVSTQEKPGAPAQTTVTAGNPGSAQDNVTQTRALGQSSLKSGVSGAPGNKALSQAAEASGQNPNANTANAESLAAISGKCFDEGCKGIAVGTVTSPPVAVSGVSTGPSIDSNAQYFVKNYASLSAAQQAVYWNELSPAAKATVEKQSSADPAMQQVVTSLSNPQSPQNSSPTQPVGASTPSNLTVEVTVHKAGGGSETTASTTAPAAGNAP